MGAALMHALKSSEKNKKHPAPPISLLMVCNALVCNILQVQVVYSICLICFRVSGIQAATSTHVSDMYLGCAHVCVPLYFYSATLYMSSGCNSPCSWHKWYKCQAAWMKNHTETLVGNILHFLGWCFSMSPESPISLCQVQPNKTHLPSHKRWINTAKTSKTRCAVKSKPLMVRPSTRWKFLLHLPHLESRHYILWTCYLYLKASKFH